MVVYSCGCSCRRTSGNPGPVPCVISDARQRRAEIGCSGFVIRLLQLRDGEVNGPVLPPSAGLSPAFGSVIRGVLGGRVMTGQVFRHHPSRDASACHDSRWLRTLAMAFTKNQPTTLISTMPAKTPRESAMREAWIMAPPMP